MKRYIPLLAVMAGGLAALAVRWDQGLSSTGLSSTVPWGVWVAFYIFFVGNSAGAFLLSTLIYVFRMKHLEEVGRQALLVAILSMGLAGVFILLDLGRGERFWHVLKFWNTTSVLAWEVRFYVLYVALLVAELYLSIRQEEGSYEKWLQILGAIGIPLAIFGVHGGTGALFAVIKARPYWNTALLPVVFVVSALVSGIALLILLYVLGAKERGCSPNLELIKSLSRLMAGFLLTDIGLQLFEMLVAVYSLKPEELSVLGLMVRGNLAWVFWMVQILAGTLVPLFLIFYPPLGNSLQALVVAAGLVLAGILGVRFNIVLPSLLVPVMEGLPQGIYLPTWVEWVSSAGLMAAGILAYQVAVQRLPIYGKEKRE